MTVIWKKMSRKIIFCVWKFLPFAGKYQKPPYFGKALWPNHSVKIKQWGILIEKHICPRPATANFASRKTIAYPTPSVFHADQRGMCPFLIRTPGPEFWGPSPSPWGTPASGRPGTDFRTHFIEGKLLVISKLVIWNFFQTSGWGPGAISIPMENPNISKARDWF